MNIEPLASLPNPDWLRMRLVLWPDSDEQQHLAEMRTLLAEPGRYAQFIAVTNCGVALGFAEASIRTDYVNGTQGSPVGFLEGLYVEPVSRRHGVAGMLIQFVADWARNHRCMELASDTNIANTVSQAVHKRLGFQETERVVYFNLLLSAG